MSLQYPCNFSARVQYIFSASIRMRRGFVFKGKDVFRTRQKDSFRTFSGWVGIFLNPTH